MPNSPHLRSKSKNSAGSQPRRLYLPILALFFAVIPPFLVIVDRWFGYEQIANSLAVVWGWIPFLNGLVWPPYFLIIFVCTLVVIVLVLAIGDDQIDRPSDPITLPEKELNPLLQRCLGLAFILSGEAGVFGIIAWHGTPGSNAGWDYALICILYLLGWFIFTIPLRSIWRFLRTSWDLIFSIVLGFISVSWLLFSYYGHYKVTFILIALTLVAIWMLYRQRRKISPSYWLFLLALILFSLELNAWYYAFIGDEYIFLDNALYFAHNSGLGEIGQNLFNANLVYGMHTFLSTLMQAVFLKLFDGLNFGWRFSSIIFSALSIVFFYYFFRTFMERWVAITAAFMIAVSHYLMGFSRIGYNNTQALLAMSLALTAASWAVKSKKHLAFVATGVALAFCFYVFAAALYIPPLILWLLLLYYPPWKRSALVDWIILGYTVLILILPLIFQPDHWTMIMGGTFAGIQHNGLDLYQLLQHTVTQYAYAFYSFLFVIEESHYVTVSYVDLLTAAFFLIGFAALLKSLWRDKFAFFVLSGFAMLLLFVGATQQYDFPTNTRMFLLIPWLCLIAANGLRWLAVRFKINSNSRSLASGALALILLFILGLNLYQAYVVSVQRSTRHQYFESEFIHLAQNLALHPTSLPQTITLVYDPLYHDIWRLRQLVEVDYLHIQVREIVVSPSKPLYLQDRLFAPGQIVVLSPFLPESVQTLYQEALDSNQRITCQMTSVLGEPRFNVWYPPNIPSPCKDTLQTPIINMPAPIPLLVCELTLLLIFLTQKTRFPLRLGRMLDPLPDRKNSHHTRKQKVTI